MTDIAERMQEARELGGLTVSDMALWFGVPRVSMSTWLVPGVSGGRHPRQDKLRQLEPLLDILNTAIKMKALPVPLSVRQYDRKEYIEKAKRDARKRISKGRTAARRG